VAKQFFFACGLALALIFAPVGASAQQQQRTPERQALLDRLGAALPPSGSSAQDAANRVRPSFAALEATMHQRNAGREAEITAMLDSYALCIGTATHAAAPGMVLDAADIALNDAEIEELTRFYAGPDYPRFSEINGRSTRGETITPEETAFMQSYTDNPVMRRFAMQTIQTAQAFPNSPAGTQIVSTCGDAFIASYRGAGLRTP